MLNTIIITSLILFIIYILYKLYQTNNYIKQNELYTKQNELYVEPSAPLQAVLIENNNDTITDLYKKYNELIKLKTNNYEILTKQNIIVELLNKNTILLNLINMLYFEYYKMEIIDLPYQLLLECKTLLNSNLLNLHKFEFFNILDDLINKCEIFKNNITINNPIIESQPCLVGRYINHINMQNNKILLFKLQKIQNNYDKQIYILELLNNICHIILFNIFNKKEIINFSDKIKKCYNKLKSCSVEKLLSYINKDYNRTYYSYTEIENNNNYILIFENMNLYNCFYTFMKANYNTEYKHFDYNYISYYIVLLNDTLTDNEYGQLNEHVKSYNKYNILQINI
jgi:hypothetical protein